MLGRFFKYFVSDRYSLCDPTIERVCSTVDYALGCLTVISLVVGLVEVVKTVNKFSDSSILKDSDKTVIDAEYERKKENTEENNK